MAVDLSAYPDLVVIYLGMRVEEPRGYETLQRLDPEIQAAVALEAWSRTLPHKAWWSEYLRDRGGTSFWHETYFRRGGIETMYVDTGETIGLSRVAPVVPAEGPMFSVRARAESDRKAASATR